MLAVDPTRLSTLSVITRPKEASLSPEIELARTPILVLLFWRQSKTTLGKYQDDQNLVQKFDTRLQEIVPLLTVSRLDIMRRFFLIRKPNPSSKISVCPQHVKPSIVIS